MRTKVINIVSFNNPFPPKYGGIIDVYYKIEALYKIGYQIHLHCFVEPFSSFLINRWHFGRMLHSVEDSERKWLKNRGL